MSTVRATGVWVGVSPFAMSFLHGEVEQHGGAAVLAAGDLDGAAVLLDDRLRNRQTEPGALGLGREERVEQLGQGPARDPDPGVAHAHLLDVEPARVAARARARRVAG